MVTPLLSAALLLGVTSSAARAQTNFLGALHFDLGIAQGDFADRIESDAFGLDVQGFYAPAISPLAIGLDVSWMNYGSDTRREPFSTTIPDVTVEVETMNNLVQAFLVLRGQVPRGPIQIYGDALVGFNYLYTETKIRDTDDVAGEIASSTNREDTAFAYGFGGGMMVPVFTRGFVDAAVRPLQVLIDAGARYVRGDDARYLKEGSIRTADGRVTFETLESKVDIVRIHVGVAVRF